MISAIDSSLILDVLTDDPVFASASEAVLRQVAGEGRLIVCERVIAEIFPAVPGDADFDEFLADWQMEFEPSSAETARLAGHYFRSYLDRGGKPGQIVPDFLIAAHARTRADRLVARARSYLRDYFSDLIVLNPSRPGAVTLVLNHQVREQGGGVIRES